ncbi:hypothetical protein NP493_660g05042 [Ridgeia piscesae]|uniref:Glycosyltransferase family 92 protein n=1 Tax=Ridgeia piscesae TaxID=27915 RepID=A0AAD9KSI8_RIDPI|nr:hypothetical protein NP493_660g05042 [Ridgeia piscesae]
MGLSALYRRKRFLIGAVTGVFLCCAYFLATSGDDKVPIYAPAPATAAVTRETTTTPIYKILRTPGLPQLVVTDRPQPEAIKLPPQSKGGRTATDGHWLLFSGPQEIFGYSAFYDNRPSLGAPPTVVRVIVVSDVTDAKKQLYCLFRYEGGVNKTASATRQAIGAGVYKRGKLYTEYIYTCPVDGTLPPEGVAIVAAPTDVASRFLPVEVPARWPEKMDFGVCVSVAYWNHTAERIVEWMELNRIIGVNHVIIYNNSLSAEAARVFAHYVASGFVDLRQSTNFIDDPGETTIHMHMSPVINDCMYRYMHRFSKILVIDLDELIVPRAHDNLTLMLAAIETAQTERHPARTYAFRNAYFFFDWTPDLAQPGRLATLRYRMRAPPSVEGTSAKCIVDPQACWAMHNHYCWAYTARFDTDAKEVSVGHSVGLNQHYKKCHLDAFEKPGACARVLANGTPDDTMLRFKQRLVPRFEQQMRELDLKNVRR